MDASSSPFEALDHPLGFLSDRGHARTVQKYLVPSGLRARIGTPRGPLGQGSPLRLTHAALSGAGAALALNLFRNGKNGMSGTGQGPPDPTAELLSGAARGVLYGAVLEPRLPGSPLLRGATFGVMEYVTSPFGGLDVILGASSPHRTMPIIAALLGSSDSVAVSVADHVVFGVTLGLLYGAGSVRRGSRAVE
jgi:hypothetical protein